MAAIWRYHKMSGFRTLQVRDVWKLWKEHQPKGHRRYISNHHSATTFCKRRGYLSILHNRRVWHLEEAGMAFCRKHFEQG